VLPTIRQGHRWSDQSDSVLQDCFAFEEYTDSVTGFIRKCIEDVVPTKPVRVYPNQKPWLNCEVRAALNARTAAFKSGHTEEYKKASYALRKTIRAAKRKPHRNPRKRPCYPDSAPHSVSVVDMCKAFKRVYIRKAARPDGIPGRILKVCAHQRWPQVTKYKSKS
ncbi:hypothetical protein NFI96_028020, partial [Prochilodus magdalenae]